MGRTDVLYQEKLERFVEHVEHRFPGGRACTLRLCRKELELVAAHGFSASEREGNIPLEGTVAGAALEAGKPLLVTIAEDPRYANKALASAQGWVTLLAVPLMRDGKRFGVIQIYSSDPRQELGEEDVEAIADEARLAAIDLELITLLMVEDERRRALLILLDDLARTTDLAVAYQRFVEEVVALLNRRACAMYRVHGRQLELVAGYPNDGKRHGIGRRCLLADLPAAQEAIERNAPVVVEDALTDVRTAFIATHLRHWNVTSICYFPIVTTNGTVPSAIALLAIDHGRDEPTFAAEDLETLRLFGHAAGVLALRERLRQNEQLSERMPRAIPRQAKVCEFTVLEP